MPELMQPEDDKVEPLTIKNRERYTAEGANSSTSGLAAGSEQGMDDGSNDTPLLTRPPQLQQGLTPPDLALQVQWCLLVM
ncbi:unnamed protein product [Chrysoparadoxa australica]